MSDIGNVIDSVTDVRNSGVTNGKPGIILVIFRQPGANMIETVDRVRALMPLLQASINPSMRIGVIIDRTTTIRSSIHDVEITLIISVRLVIFVVFVFLRNVWATIIPSVAVPLVAGGHVRRDVSLRLQPGQPFADGADDFDRASSWTTPSWCWKTSPGTSKAA